MKITVLLENTSTCSDVETEHGLSLFLETPRHRILFDTGQSEAFARNAGRLGIDLSTVDLAVISHGHYDHTGGIRRFLELNGKAPVCINRHAFESHISEDGRNIGMDPSLQGHPQIVLTDDILDIDEEVSLRTCNGVPSPYENSAAGMFTISEGKMHQDAFLHEQYLCLTLQGKRIVVSGCSHKGILNICRWLHPDVLIGGFHFMRMDVHGPDQERLDHAAEELLARSTLYYTCHCTGVEQYTYLKKHMGNALHYISGGQTLVI